MYLLLWPLLFRLACFGLLPLLVTCSDSGIIVLCGVQLLYPYVPQIYRQRVIENDKSAEHNID